MCLLFFFLNQFSFFFSLMWPPSCLGECACVRAHTCVRVRMSVCPSVCSLFSPVTLSICLLPSLPHSAALCPSLCLTRTCQVSVCLLSLLLRLSVVPPSVLLSVSVSERVSPCVLPSLTHFLFLSLSFSPSPSLSAPASIIAPCLHED